MRTFQHNSRNGYTLVELVFSLLAAAALITATASVIHTTMSGLDANLPAMQRADAADLMADINLDINHAISFSERTSTATTFKVPDRDGDLIPETIRYNWTGAVDRKLQYQLNGGPVITLHNDVDSFNLSYLTRLMLANVGPQAGSGGTKVLFVVTNDTSMTTQEAIRKAYMESWGFVVNLLDDGSNQSAYDAAVAANDVAYVSCEASALSVGTKLRQSAIGVVNEHAGLADDFGFATSTVTFGETGTQITEIDHYITSTHTTGQLTLLTSSQQLNGLDGTLSPDHNELAKETSDPTLTCLKTGDALESGGGTAPDRRVQLPWGAATFDINALNDDGKTIMKRSIEWASGVGADGPIPPANFGDETIFANASGPADLVAKDLGAVQVTLPEDGELTSISMYLAGVPGKKYQFAIYTDAGGEPGTKIVTSATGNDGGTSWRTKTVTETVLSAGTYWLAFSMEKDNHKYYRENTGGEFRLKADHDPFKNGWPASWGTSTSSATYKVSIYGTYTPQ